MQHIAWLPLKQQSRNPYQKYRLETLHLKNFSLSICLRNAFASNATSLGELLGPELCVGLHGVVAPLEVLDGTSQGLSRWNILKLLSHSPFLVLGCGCLHFMMWGISWRPAANHLLQPVPASDPLPIYCLQMVWHSCSKLAAGGMDDIVHLFSTWRKSRSVERPNQMSKAMQTSRAGVSALGLSEWSTEWIALSHVEPISSMQHLVRSLWILSSCPILQITQKWRMPLTLEGTSTSTSKSSIRFEEKLWYLHTINIFSRRGLMIFPSSPSAISLKPLQLGISTSSPPPYAPPFAVPLRRHAARLRQRQKGQRPGEDQKSTVNPKALQAFLANFWMCWFSFSFISFRVIPTVEIHHMTP